MPAPKTPEAIVADLNRAQVEATVDTFVLGDLKNTQSCLQSMFEVFGQRLVTAHSAESLPKASSIIEDMEDFLSALNDLYNADESVKSALTSTSTEDSIYLHFEAYVIACGLPKAVVGMLWSQEQVFVD